MVGERLAMLVENGCLRRFDGARGAGVELAPALAQQGLVGDFLRDGVLEAVDARAAVFVVLDEIGGH